MSSLRFSSFTKNREELNTAKDSLFAEKFAIFFNFCNSGTNLSMSDQQNISTGELLFCSSVKDGRWHSQEGSHAFERWHFDALSDDGREALIITFHDNYPLSPRYFGQNKNTNDESSTARGKFPAVSFIYAIDGRAVVRTVNEFSFGEFAADEENGCSIGSSSFRVEAASYGSGYVLTIDLLTARKRRIKAELEWLSVESDLSETTPSENVNNVWWNMAVPRSDVSGRITLLGRKGKVRGLVHFRGTGYHDHFRSGRSLSETVGSRYWGRAHFMDSTAIFHYHDLGGDSQPCAKLFLIRDGAIHQRDVVQPDEGLIRTGHGLKVPQRLSFLSDDNIRLRIKPVKVIQPGFFESRMLSEMTLMLRDGKPRKTVGITELLTPLLMRSRFFRWLTDLRIGKNGKEPLY